MPSLQVAPGGFWGRALTVESWFAGVGLGRTTLASGSNGLMLAGGYRWSNDESISLQLVRDRRESLGLALSYDWPRYFVRLGVDQQPAPAPKETVRFSAGMRF
jgi:hypothetical protein